MLFIPVAWDLKRITPSGIHESFESLVYCLKAHILLDHYLPTRLRSPNHLM